MSCEPVCVCVSLVRVVIICLASTHTCVNVKAGGRTRAALPSDVTWDASEAACQTDPSFGAHPETSPLETEFNCLVVG